MSEAIKHTNMCINSNETDAAKILTRCIKEYIEATKKDFTKTVILCIGSDRATGDSLGPITGSIVAEKIPKNSVAVYGRLEKTVHAGNIENVQEEIKSKNSNPLIIAVDAALSKTAESVGLISAGIGCVHPGSYSGKKLPPVGDIFVTGVVNWSPMLKDIEILQSTKLSTVVKMAEVISYGLIEAFR